MWFNHGDDGLTRRQRKRYARRYARSVGTQQPGVEQRRGKPLDTSSKGVLD